MTFIIYLMYKQKAPIDLQFLEFHTDNDVARIISFLSVSGEGNWGWGAQTNNLTCVNGALADIQKHITDEAKRRYKRRITEDPWRVHICQSCQSRLDSVNK